MAEHTQNLGSAPPSLKSVLTPAFTLSLVAAWVSTISELPLSILQTFRLVSLHHYKERHGPEHEYLLAILVIPHASRNNIRHVRVERRSMSSTSLRLIGRSVQADDSISISPSPFNTAASYSLCHLQFPEASRPNILEFAAMLEAIISLDPSYRLYTSDCYWFARMIFEGMAHAFHGQVSPGEQPEQRGKFARVFPVLNRKGVPYFGASSIVKRWMKYRVAVVHTAAPGVDPRMIMMHELIGDLYSRRREQLYALAARAEETTAPVDDLDSEARFESILAIVLCCFTGIMLLSVVL